MGKIASVLFRAARVATDLETIGSGDPTKVGRRMVNKLKGRTLIGRTGLYRGGSRKGKKR